MLQDDLWDAISFLSSNIGARKAWFEIESESSHLHLTWHSLASSRVLSCFCVKAKCVRKHSRNLTTRLWLLFNGNHCLSRRPIHCTTMPWDIVDPRIQRATPDKISPSRSSWPLLVSTGKPTVSFNDPGLGHLRILDAQIIRNIVLGLKKHLCIWLGWNWCEMRIPEQTRYIAWQWTSRADRRDCSGSRTWFRCCTSRSEEQGEIILQYTDNEPPQLLLSPYIYLGGWSAYIWATFW